MVWYNHVSFWDFNLSLLIEMDLELKWWVQHRRLIDFRFMRIPVSDRWYRTDFWSWGLVRCCDSVWHKSHRRTFDEIAHVSIEYPLCTSFRNCQINLTTLVTKLKRVSVFVPICPQIMCKLHCSSFWNSQMADARKRLCEIAHELWELRKARHRPPIFLSTISLCDHRQRNLLCIPDPTVVSHLPFSHFSLEIPQNQRSLHQNLLLNLIFFVH
jgi:hypothetical protein